MSFLPTTCELANKATKPTRVRTTHRAEARHLTPRGDTMYLRHPRFIVPILPSLLLLGFTVSLIGCGNGIPAPNSSVPLPADATYNNSVRSTGYSITDLG